MSIIAAGTTTTTALSSTGNTDGTLQFQVNGTTPSVTLNTLGAIGVGSTPGYGSSGQVLTSAGSTAAPTWSTNVSSQWTTSGSNIYYNTGNVIGVGTSSLSAWTSINAAIDLGASVAVANTYGGGASIAYNCWQNGATSTWYYKNSALASIYEQNAGTHVWKTAGSGTAGNAITFTQVMDISTTGVVSDQNGKLRAVPQSGSSKTTSYTLATTDVGEYILLSSSGAIVIPDATFSAGDVVTIFNNTASTATITCTITTAYIAGTYTDKATMTLAAAGVATVLFITSTLCVVSGNVT